MIAQISNNHFFLIPKCCFAINHVEILIDFSIYNLIFKCQSYIATSEYIYIVFTFGCSKFFSGFIKHLVLCLLSMSCL